MNDRKGPRAPSRDELDLFHRTVGEADAVKGGKPHKETPPPDMSGPSPASSAAAAKANVSRGGRGPTKGAKVDARLDLHGLTLEAAYKSLDAFIDRARAAGQTRLLVITGKGGRGRGRQETHMESRGRLSVKVPLWLERRAGVAAVERAHPRHGGEGAIYVILKRKS